MMQKLTFYFALVYLFLVSLGCLYVWPYGDDFLNKVGMMDKSPLEYSFQLFFNWDGRQISPFALIQMVIIKWLPTSLGILIYYSAFLLFCSLLHKIIFRFQYDHGYFNSTLIRSYFIFTSILLIALIPYYKDVLYWVTGGAYMISLLQGMLLFFLFLIFIENESLIKNQSYVSLTCILILVFFLSLNSQNLNISLAILFFSIIFINRAGSFKKEIHFFIFFLIIFFSANVLVSVAPGNFIRMSNEITSSDLFHFSPREILLMYFKFIRYTKWSVLLGLLAGLFLFKNDKSIFSKSESKSFFNLFLLFIILALATMFPFIFSTALARIRTYFYGSIFFFIAGVYLGGFFNMYLFRLNFISKILPVIQSFGIFFMIWQLSLMIPFSLKTKSRFDFLESNRGSNSTVRYPILRKPDKLIIIRWANEENFPGWNHVQEYYQLKKFEEY